MLVAGYSLFLTGALTTLTCNIHEPSSRGPGLVKTFNVGTWSEVEVGGTF